MIPVFMNSPTYIYMHLIDGVNNVCVDDINETVTAFVDNAQYVNNKLEVTP